MKVAEVDETFKHAKAQFSTLEDDRTYSTADQDDWEAALQQARARVAF